MRPLMEEIQVNIPFIMLEDGYLERFLSYRLNPEIGFDAEALDHYGVSNCRRIGERLTASGLSVTLHSPFLDLSPGSLDPRIWEVTRSRFEAMVRLIPIFKPKSVVCHMGYDAKRYGYMTESWRAKSVKMWSWLAGLVGDAGSRLMLENVYEYGPDPVWDLFRDLPDLPVGFCLDTGHLSAFGREPLEKWIDRLGPIIGQLHLHDNGGEWDDHLALGMGNIDFPLLFQRLISIRESPPIVTLEPHREEDLWPSFDYLEGVWPW